MPYNCAHGKCNSDTRHPEEGVRFVKFPSKTLQKELCSRWAFLCNRKKFCIKKVNANSRICSKHFPAEASYSGNEKSSTLLDPDILPKKATANDIVPDRYRWARQKKTPKPADESFLILQPQLAETVGTERDKENHEILDDSVIKNQLPKKRLSPVKLRDIGNEVPSLPTHSRLDATVSDRYVHVESMPSGIDKDFELSVLSEDDDEYYE